MRRYCEDIMEVIEDFRFEPLSYSAWHDYMIIPTRVIGHGKASGIDIDLEMTFLASQERPVLLGRYVLQPPGRARAIGATDDELDLIE